VAPKPKKGAEGKKSRPSELKTKNKYPHKKPVKKEGEGGDYNQEITGRKEKKGR